MLCGPALAIASACTPSCCLICNACRGSAFFGQIGINQIAETLLEDIDQLLREFGLNLDAFGRGAERGELVGD